MKYNEKNSQEKEGAEVIWTKWRKGKKLKEAGIQEEKFKGAEDRKVPILSIPKEKNYFPGEKLKKKIWQAETLIKEEIEQTLGGAKKEWSFLFFYDIFQNVKDRMLAKVKCKTTVNLSSFILF